MTMNKHQRDQFYKRVILQAIDHNYMGECGYKTLVDACKNEMGITGQVTQKDVSEWLQGLPSACTIPFHNWDIIEMAKETGLIDDKSTEARIDKVIEEYWTVMAAKVIQISNGYHVPNIDETEE